MKKTIITVTLLSLLINTAVAKGFGKDDIAKFCSDKKSPITGKQFNGESANTSVLKLVAGKYSYPNGGAMLLFANNNYIVKLPNNRDGIHGTDGDDLIASGGILGGCSKEQLSEVVAENGLSAGLFVLVKRYKIKSVK